MTSSQQRAAPTAQLGPGPPAPRRGRVVLAAGLTLLAAAAGFAAMTRADRARPPFTGLDQAWLSLVRGTRSTPVTEGFKVLSLAGGPTGATIVVGVVGAGLLLAARWRTAIYLGLAEVLGSSCSQLIKHVVMRHRPPQPLVSADIGSFPSGHVIATIGVGLALTFALARPGYRRGPLVAVTAAGLLMMFCRTYLAAHWLSDTFESVLVATGIGLVLWWAFGPLLERDRDRPARFPWSRQADPEAASAAGDSATSAG